MKHSVVYVLGDICPRWGNSEQFSTGNPYDVFHEIIDLFSEADLVIANLEAPATYSGKQLKKNSMNLRLEPTDIKVLSKAGIHGLALANNHILDYGVEGVTDTIRNIQEEGMFCYGAGTEEAARRPQIVSLDGVRIGLLSFAEQEFNCAKDYGVGANMWDDLESIACIRNTKKMCDYLVIQYHGGIEEYPYPSPRLQKKCRAMAEAGANLVTCQHSHCVGTRERWKNTEILYGQGNSVFGYEVNNDEWNIGVLIKIEISEGIEVSYIPIEASKDGEHLMSKSNTLDYLTKFYKKSEMLRASYLPMLFSWGRVANKLNRIFKGRIINIFTKEKSRMNAMNLIRCEAHREVLATILEKEFMP